MTIFQVGDITPRRFTHLFLLFRRSRDLGRALLEFNRIDTSMNCRINNLLGDLDITIMIDSDFSDDIRGMPIADHSIANFDFTSHSVSPQVSSTPYHTIPSRRHNRPVSITHNPRRGSLPDTHQPQQLTSLQFQSKAGR